jgi:GT2 family glycosyltransferase
LSVRWEKPRSRGPSWNWFYDGGRMFVGEAWTGSDHSAGDLGVVVNYYSSGSSREANKLLVAATSLSLRLLKMNPAVDAVLLVDGSRKPDELICEACKDIGVQYYHDGKEISYVRAYNIGWRKLSQPYIALMANDIIPHPLNVMALLLEWIRRPDVGCVFPYLMTNRLGSDETQKPGFWRRGFRTCEPSSMTLNLNVFKRSVLEEIGGLDENYLYAFAEPILLVKIRSRGYRAIMVGGAVAFHFDRLTKTTGESSLTQEMYDEDARRWFREYPRYADDSGLANLRLWVTPFTTTHVSRALWWLSYHAPGKRLRLLLRVFTMWAEPLFTTLR